MATYKIRRRKARLGKASTVAATEAAKTFGRLVDRVREERASYVVERGGKPVAQIGPVDARGSTMRDFVALLKDTPSANEEYLGAVEHGIATLNKPRVPKNPWAR